MPDWLKRGQVIYHWADEVPDMGDVYREKWKYGIVAGFLSGSDRIFFAMISSYNMDGLPKLRREYWNWVIDIPVGTVKRLKKPSYVECHRLAVKYGSLLVVDFAKYSNTECLGPIPGDILTSVMRNLITYGSSDGNFSQPEMVAISSEIGNAPDYSHLFNGDGKS